ncbi:MULTISPECIES: molybdate ABC transporter permease subunit [Metabacillus]|uniref:Molybdenum transport system permease n=1 Tax=Metabacillus indicus TaxID=246786 RepID=A0A084GJH9_METID|nr:MULTISPECIES: molybdate ABC transporter permease subunit [Metabacillus]KEZ47491.1 molybdenum ABC transporter permease [Metabacillus indicus]KEZ47986.1 molybdenum ABC transporter permease [Metabacillus indicus LMG 22858]
MWTDASGPVLLSVQVAVISTIFVAASGILAGRLMARASFKGKTLLETILMLPLVLPPTVVGFLLIVAFGVNSPAGRLIEGVTGSPLIFTVWAAVIAAGVVSFPLMYQAAKLGFQMVDREIEDASKVDGAGGMQTFMHITLPLAVPSLITGVVLSFTRALGEFGASLMFAGNIPGQTQTAATAIYVAMDSGDMNLAWLLTGVLVLLSFTLLFFVQMLKRP